LPTEFNDTEKTFLTNLEIDEMWKNILEKKDFNDESSFPNLKEFMNLKELCRFVTFTF